MPKIVKSCLNLSKLRPKYYWSFFSVTQCIARWGVIGRASFPSFRSQDQRSRSLWGVYVAHIFAKGCIDSRKSKTIMTVVPCCRFPPIQYSVTAKTRIFEIPGTLGDLIK